ncbi:MAG TPA: MFS transporter [Candidatus Limnocylindria bacterium]|nr:MFS transporter [Candidatus Limnocylindria bacterium]
MAACVPVFVGALDLTVVSAVLPAVLLELKIPIQEGIADASWTVSGYLAAYVFGMLIMAGASDRLGRREAFLIALGIFSVGSLASAASADGFGQWIRGLERAVDLPVLDPSMPKIHALVAGRVLQGFGAGALVPVAMAVAADLFVEARAAAIGAVAAVDTAGWVLGHLYGGIVVQAFPWQALFWANLPLAAVSAAVAWSALRALPRGDPRSAFDRLGAVLLGLALAGITLAFGGNELSGPPALARPVGAPGYALPAALVGILALAAFVALERRATGPLVDVRLLAERGTAAFALANVAVGFCAMVGLVSVPLLVNTIGARSSREGALASGELLALLTIPLALAAVPGGVLTIRAGPRPVAVVGLALAAAGFVQISRWDAGTVREAVDLVTLGAVPSGAIAPMIAGLVLAGVGLGLATAPLAVALIDRAPAARRGSTSAFVISLRLLGMSVSAGLLTSFGLRSLAVIAQGRLAELASPDPVRAIEASRGIATQVSAEMAVIAAGAAVVGLVAAACGSNKDAR